MEINHFRDCGETEYHQFKLESLKDFAERSVPLLPPEFSNEYGFTDVIRRTRLAYSISVWQH